MDHRVTLTQHLLREVEAHAPGGGTVASILAQIATACKEIRAELAEVGLGSLAGMQGGLNVQGESVHKLDWFANEVFTKHFQGSGLLCTLISEEMEDIFHLDDDCPRAQHVLCYDPMDGSSNLDVDGAVGTIFSVRRKATGKTHGKPEEVFEPGTEQVAAGYVLYGPQCMLVYGVGGSVNGFTLDTAVGEFFLSHPNIRMPEHGKEYSANIARLEAWDPGIASSCAAIRTAAAPGARIRSATSARWWRTSTARSCAAACSSIPETRRIRAANCGFSTRPRRSRSWRKRPGAPPPTDGSGS